MWDTKGEVKRDSKTRREQENADSYRAQRRGAQDSKTSAAALGAILSSVAAPKNERRSARMRGKVRFDSGFRVLGSFGLPKQVDSYSNKE